MKTPMTKSVINLFGALAFVALSTVSVQAATITWNTPVTISGDIDVATTGNLLYAYNGANSTVSVNGVSFTGENSTTTWGSVGISISGGGSANTTAYGSGSGSPWSSLSANYQTVLKGGDYANNASSAITVTLNSLTSGKQYLVQVWVNDNRASTSRSETVVGGGGNTVTLNYNNTTAAGGVGQYAIGTFTASATSQTFTLTGAASSQLNAIQVRDMTSGYFSGASATIWDASTTADWASASGGSYNQTWSGVAGANAVFEGTANTVTVNGSVSDGSIAFNTDGYTLAQGTSGLLTLTGGSITTGAGSDTIGVALAGTLPVTKYGSGTLTLSGANTYSGATIISGGTLQLGAGGTTGTLGSGGITDNSALTFNYGASGNVSFANAITGTGTVGIVGVSGARVHFSGANTYSGVTTINSGNTLEINASGATSANSDYTVNGSLDFYNGSAFNVSLGALNGSSSGQLFGDNVAFGVTIGANGNSGTYAGTIYNGWGSGVVSITKSGAGTQTLSGNNTYTGATSVNAGILTVSGSLVGTASNAGQINVGQSGSTANATLNIQTGAIITQNGSGNILIGNGTSTANGNGAVYQSGGTVSGVNQLQLGASTGGSYGYYKLSGGTVSLKELDLSGGSGLNALANAVLDISGGTMTVANWFVPTRGTGAGISIINMTGGTLNYNGGGGEFSANWNTGGSTFVLNLANASLLSANTTSLNLMRAAASANLGEINLLSGGLLQANSLAPSTATGTSLVNFNGGTLKANAATTTFITTLNTAVNVYGGGGTIDNNNINITIPKALSAPSGSGINSAVTITGGGGSGYVGAPAVTISGGSGVGAAGYATISAGAVNGIVITSPGTGYSSTPTIALTGGGGSGAGATAPPPTANTSGGLTFQGSGTTTLTGANTYTGDTTISAGTLALGTGGSLSSANIIINSGKIFDVSAIAYTVAASQALRGLGNVNGSVTLNNSTSFINPGTSSGVGTITFNNNLTMTSGGATFRLSTSASSGNDKTVVTGNLTIGNGDTIHISALSGAANLDTSADYVLFSVSGTTTMSTTPALAWDGTQTANYLNYSIQKVGQNVVLHYTSASAPTVVATSSPATVTRNQTITVTATVTPGSPGSVTNVQINASAIGGSSTATLVLSGTPNVYTNTFTVASNVAPGVVMMPVIAIDNTPLTSPACNVTNTIVATNEVWTGLGGNNNWSTSPNWNTSAPASSGDAVTFAGSTQTNPNLDNNYSVTGVTFAGATASFTLTTANSSTLTLAGGVTNNSANTETINVPVTMNTTQPINASAGNLAFGQNITNGGNTITFTGSSNTAVSGAVSGSGALTASGSGAVTLSGANTYSGTTTVSAGTLALSGSGTLGASTAAVTVSGGTLNLGATSQNSGTATVSGGTLTNGTLTATNLALQSGTVSAVLAGTSIPVSKTTAGAVTLSGANTYSGTTTVSAGTLNLNHAAALGTSTLAISGGTLDNTSGATVTLNNNPQSWNGDFTFAGTANLNLGTGAVTPNASRTVTVSVNNLTVGGSISGTGGLTKAGNGTLTLSAATNTFTGELQVNGGTLVWNSAAALAPSAGDFQPLNVQFGGALIVNGLLKYSSGTAGVNGYLNVGNGGAGGFGTITINSGGSLTFTNQTGNPNSVVGQFGTGGTSLLNVNGGVFNWDGTSGLFIGNAGGSGELLITNGGTATILKGTGTSDEGYLAIGRNSSTSTGMVYLATGTLATDRVIARGTATPIGVGYVVFDGGTLKALANQSDWLQAAVSGNANPPNAVTIADGGAKINANGFSVAINNVLLHGGVAATDGGLTLINSSGTGTLTLGGANTYTGNTTISAGTLALSGSGSLATPKIIIASGAKFDVSGLTSTFALGSGQTLTNISGTGNLAGNVNLASGALALSYTNGTPALNVTNGTLVFNGNAVTVAVAGSLPHGIYKLISTNSGGVVSGTLPSTVTVNGIGTATASLSISNGELYLTVNHPPVAGNATYTRNAGIYGLRITISDLLTNVTDADSDTITLVAVGNSTNGVIVSLSGTNLLNYYNTNNVNDQFSYTVTDGFGGTNTGLVSIVVSNAATGQITGQFTSFTGGVANLVFHGIPNYSYITERSTNLTDWVDVATNSAATNGVISVSDTFGDLGGVPPSSAYYRLKWQP
jgi:autotransporter-associated beta strand protein